MQISRTIILAVMLLMLVGCSNNQIQEPISSTEESSEKKLEEVEEIVLPTEEEILMGDPLYVEMEGLIESETERVPVFATLSDEEITSMELKCGDAENAFEVGRCIRTWQYGGMRYCSKNGFYPSCISSITWNTLAPGVLEAKDIIHRNSDGVIYGTSLDHAMVLCSIAETYNVECRIMNSKTMLSDVPESKRRYKLPETGMSEEEYATMVPYLEAKGIELSYDDASNKILDAPAHYWAEVNVEGKWFVMDKTEDYFQSSTMGTFQLDGDFEIYNPGKKDSLVVSSDDEMNEEMDKDESNVEVDTATSEEVTGEKYFGVSDDLAQAGRAKNLVDLEAGKALAPYYESCDQICKFLDEGSICQGSCNVKEDSRICYEECSTLKVYSICDIKCQGDADYAGCYLLCSGEELDQACHDSCLEI